MYLQDSLFATYSKLEKVDELNFMKNFLLPIYGKNSYLIGHKLGSDTQELLMFIPNEAIINI
jgi:hypothetical protein